MKQKLINDLISLMNLRQFEKKYELNLSLYELNSPDYFAWRSTYYSLPGYFWTDVSKDPEIPIDFIRLYKDFIVWDVVNYSKFADNKQFIKEFTDYIDWWKFSEFFVAKNEENTIREYINYIDTQYCGQFNWNISLDFVREFRDKINWIDDSSFRLHTTNALKNTKMCDEFANEILWISANEVLSHKYNFYSNLKFSKKLFQRFVQPHTIAQLLWYDVLDEETLEEFIIPQHSDNKEIMLMMFEHCTLSEQFLEKYSGIINNFNFWSTITKCQELSEQFIDRWKKKVNWCNVVKYRNVSEKFLEEHLIYIKKYLNDLLRIRNLDEKFIERNIKWLSISNVVKHQILSDEFIEKYLNDNPYLKDIALQRRKNYVDQA